MIYILGNISNHFIWSSGIQVKKILNGNGYQLNPYATTATDAKSVPM